MAGLSGVLGPGDAAGDARGDGTGDGTGDKPDYRGATVVLPEVGA